MGSKLRLDETYGSSYEIGKSFISICDIELWKMGSTKELKII